MNPRFLFTLLGVVLILGCGSGKKPDPTPPPGGGGPGSGQPQIPSPTLPRPPAPGTDGPGTAPSTPVGAPARADEVFFPGAGVRLVCPDGFEKSANFEGFQQAQTQASILALSMPAPFAQATAGFTPEQMKTRGWTFRSREEVKLDQTPALLIHFEQPARGISFVKWSLALGTEKKTILVTATFPKVHEKELSDLLKSALLRTRVAQGAEAAVKPELPFAIEPSKKLKTTEGMSGTLSLTRSGVLGKNAPGDPLFLVAKSISSDLQANSRETAERRLKEMALTRDLQVEKTDAITVDGLEGWESVAGAKEAKTGAGLVIYQVMLFDQGSYYLLQGRVGAEQRDEFLPEFKAMARSFKRRTR